MRFLVVLVLCVTEVSGCVSGTYGVDCGQTCSVGCENVCDQETGQCSCLPGYTGPRCDAAESIKCYKCDSRRLTSCRDPFYYIGVPLVDCYGVCAKATLTLNNQTEVARDCVESCDAAEYKEKRGDDEVTLACCTTSLCNGATVPRVRFAWVAAVLACAVNWFF